jgi:two-component system, chemotaxis family, sensor kinase Cph1
VQNNLQILTSMVSRQQRRAQDPAVRRMLCEVRARMVPVALAHRFVVPPALHSTIDTHAYLSELAQQLHLSLEGETRGLGLDVSIAGQNRPVADATNMGLIATEALIAGYARPADAGPATAIVRHVANEDGGSTLTVGVTGGEGRAIDETMVRELARQLSAHVVFDGSGLVHLTIPNAGAQGTAQAA